MGERQSCHRGMGRGENVFDELCRRLVERIELAVRHHRFLSLRTPFSVRTLVIPTIHLALKVSKV